MPIFGRYTHYESLRFCADLAQRAASGSRAMCASKRVSHWLSALALSAEPAAVRADQATAFGAVIENGWRRRLGHAKSLARTMDSNTETSAQSSTLRKAAHDTQPCWSTRCSVCP